MWTYTEYWQREAGVLYRTFVLEHICSSSDFGKAQLAKKQALEVGSF